MEFKLNLLSKFKKKAAKNINNFLKFDPSHDICVVDQNLFGISLSQDIYFAKSKKDYKKALKSDHEFIYFQKKGLLFFNENKSDPKFGNGGVLAVFRKKTFLELGDFKFIQSETPAPVPAPTPAPVPSRTPSPVPTPAPVPTPSTDEQKFSYQIVLDKLRVNEGERVNGTILTNLSEGSKVWFTSLSNGINYSDSWDSNYIYDEATGEVFYTVDSEGKAYFWDEWIDDGIVEGDDEITYQIFGDGDYSDLLASSEVLTVLDGAKSLSPTPVPTPTPAPVPTPTPEPALEDAVFAQGPRPKNPVLQTFSDSIDIGGEVDRFPISSSVGDVVSLSVDAADGTYPMVRLVDSEGRVLAPVRAYNGDSASTSGYRVTGDALFAEVYTQAFRTGSYELQVERYQADAPLRSIPHDLLILLDQDSMDSADQYASRYLFSDEGLIYVSFGSGLSDEMKRWWEDVLAATDVLIEPEFVVVPQAHPKSQMELNQTSASSLSGGAAGIYQTPRFTWSELVDGSNYNYRRATQQGSITLSAGAFTHSSRFASSREGGWKSTAFHELGHALGLEHPHESSDGDVDRVIDTNGTVMSYEKVQDADGDPGFTALDVQALQFVYGSESGVSTPSPLPGVPLLIDSRTFDLSQRWKSPQLSAAWLEGNSVQEPSSGLSTKIFQLTRSNGDLAIESKIWLDFEMGSGVMNWNSLTGYSEGFHDVLILGNSVTFQPGEATALFELPIVAGSHAESDEWLDVTVRPEYSSHYSEVPDAALRLTIVDA